MDSLPLQQRSKLFSWSSSVDSTTGDEVSFLEDWNVLKDMIMLLDDKNYARNSKVISSTLMDVMKCQSDNTPTLCILHLLYEKALRDTLTKAFPVSANLLESLTSNCIQKVFDNVKGSIENSLNCLQKKLQQVLILSGTDIGVIYLLLSMCKLDSLESNVSPTTYIITQLIKDTKDYLDKVQYEDKFVSDELVIYLYGLICFSLQYELMNSDINFIIIYLRKVYLLKAHMFTVLGRVMAIDIIEQLHKKDVHIQLYSAVYKKILSSKHTFLLREVKLFLSLHECPIPAISINDQSDCADEGFQTILPSSSNSSNLLQRCSRESSPILPQKESILTNSDKNVNDFTEKKTSTDLIDPSLNKYSNKKSWNKCILDFQVNKPDDLLTEILEIEERFFSSVQGYEGMVVRELERKSGAVIKIRAKDFTRPNTSSLTAHKLITGALGVPAQKPIIEEELQKLKDARIKRQNQDQEIITRQLKIIGCQDNIDKAKKLIKNICDNSVTLSVALDLTVDEILEYSVKLKGIEVLLNVYMVVNEQIDNSVIITICGEMKCCQDARKLILEEVGSFRIQDGCLFTVPSELMSVCGSREGLEELVDVISRFSGGNIIVLTSLPKYMVFVGGSSNEISKAINIFQKVNIELLCSLNSNYDAIDKLEFDVEDLVEYISKRFGHEFVSQSRLPTLMSKYFKEEKKTTKRFVYSCDELMGYANCKYAEEFPEFLCNMEDNLAYSIIKPQFVDNAIKRVNYGNVARNKENNMLHKDEQTDRPKSMSATIRSTKDRIVHPRDEFMAYAHCKYPEEFSELLRNMEDNIGCNTIKQDESTQSQF